jgi:hypothetical protein
MAEAAELTLKLLKLDVSGRGTSPAYIDSSTRILVKVFGTLLSSISGVER